MSVAYFDEDGELVMAPEISPPPLDSPELQALERGHPLQKGETQRTFEKTVLDPPFRADSDPDVWYRLQIQLDKAALVHKVRNTARHYGLRVSRMFLTVCQGYVYCEAFYCLR